MKCQTILNKINMNQAIEKSTSTWITRYLKFKAKVAHERHLSALVLSSVSS